MPSHRSLLLAFLLCSCGPSEPTPMAVTGGQHVAVEPLLEQWHGVTRVEGLLADLTVTTALSIPSPPELSHNGEFRVIGVPHLPLPSSLKLTVGDAVLPRVESLRQVREEPSYLHAPARLRWQAEDSATKGERLRMLFIAGEPERVRLKPGTTIHNRLEFVLGAPTLRVQAKMEGDEPVPLNVLLKEEVIGTLEITSSEWSTVELSFPRTQRPHNLTLQVPESATGSVLVDWWEVVTDSPDLLLVTTPSEEALTLEYRPIPPSEQEDLMTAWRGMGRAFGLFLGPEAELRFEGDLTSMQVGNTIFDAEDLAEGRITLKPTAGLHEIHIEGTPTSLTLVQPACRSLPLVLDPSLRWQDFCLEDPEQFTVPAEVARRVRSRFDRGGDRRAAFWLPAPSALEQTLDLGPGDELRHAFGVHLPGQKVEGEPVQFRVLWKQAGQADRLLDEASWEPGDAWLDRRVKVDETWAGPGILRFETLGSGATGTIAAVANPRVVTVKPGSRPTPNVLVYMIDTLRADRVGCYEPHENPTPHLDALAEDGYLFENFSAAASWTRPSTATVLTGLYPMTHGAIARDLALPTNVVTLAESFRAAGLSTWAAVYNVQVHARGLQFEQGFDRFVTTDAFVFEGKPGLSSKAVNDTVVPWLEQGGDEPFFLYLHSTDPHTPYQAPGPFGEGIQDYQGTLDPIPLSPRVEMPEGFTPTGEEERYLLDLYDGAVRFQDAQFGVLMEHLERLGLRENTFIVVLSDHGEEFHEHGDWEHGGRSWEELLHVPFLVWVPPAWREELLPVPARIEARYTHADLLPSLLELVGADLLGPTQGESFVPSLMGDPQDRPLLVQERWNFGTVMQGEYKLLWRVKANEEEEYQLYHLGSDPDERVDLTEQETARVDGMIRLRENILKKLEEAGFLGDGGSIQMSPEEIAEMRRLGYVD